MHSLSARLPLLQIDYGTVVSAETELCLPECAAPVLCLQCVLINWLAPARPPVCIWPLHQTAEAKINRPSQNNRLEGKPQALQEVNTMIRGGGTVCLIFCTFFILTIKISKLKKIITGYCSQMNMSSHLYCNNLPIAKIIFSDIYFAITWIVSAELS